MAFVFRAIELQQLLAHQRRAVQFRQMLVERALCVAEARFAIRAAAAVDGVEELFDVGFGHDAVFDVAARETELVAPVGQAGFHEGGERGVGFGWCPVGRADGEEVRDEFRVPERGSVDDGSSLCT